MTYSFSCNVCQHHFDKQMTFAEYETKRVRCPNCKSSQVRRAITRPAVIRFKGSGFYSTDNKKGK